MYGVICLIYAVLRDQQEEHELATHLFAGVLLLAGVVPDPDPGAKLQEC